MNCWATRSHPRRGSSQNRGGDPASRQDQQGPVTHRVLGRCFVCAKGAYAPPPVRGVLPVPEEASIFDLACRKAYIFIGHTLIAYQIKTFFNDSGIKTQYFFNSKRHLIS